MDSAVLLVPASCTYVQPVVFLVVCKYEWAIREEEAGRRIFEVSLVLDLSLVLDSKARLSHTSDVTIAHSDIL